MENYKDYLENQEKKIDAMIREIKESIERAPEGGLRITHNHGSLQYYRCGADKNNEYIRKQDVSLAMELAQKEYDRKILKILEADKKKIKNAWNECQFEEMIRVYDELSDDRKALVTPRLLNDKDYIRQWESVQYEGKEFLKDIPEIYTEKGERVRSKSEKLIADKLYMMGIPYRYEYPLTLKGFGTIYPDFLLLNVASRTEIILEHFGMMDYEEYCEKAIRKIILYEKHDIFPGDRLILTYETSRTPLDLRLVQKLLEKFCVNGGNQGKWSIYSYTLK